MDEIDADEDEWACLGDERTVGVVNARPACIEEDESESEHDESEDELVDDGEFELRAVELRPYHGECGG